MVSCMGTPYYSKDLYQVSIGNIEKAMWVFNCWADRADLGSTETAKQKLKYATFDRGFFNLSWAKNIFKICLKKL